jgi:hypothetical protein
LVRQRVHEYPSRVGLLWQAQKLTLSLEAREREGKPIIRREAWFSGGLVVVVVVVVEEEWVTGGVVAARKSSRKCCSCSATA